MEHLSKEIKIIIGSILIILGLFVLNFCTHYVIESQLDIADRPSVKNYLSNIQTEIKTNWDPIKTTYSYQVVTEFNVNRDGTISNIKILKSSNNKEADNKAIKTLENTKLPRLPYTLKGDSITINFTFDYNVKRKK